MTHPVASMTGAGSGAADHEIGRFAVEVRSVNHRFLKTTVRAHGPVPAVDRLVEDAVRKNVRRGHVTVHVRFTPAAAAAGQGIDDEAFSEGVARLAALAASHDLRAPVLSDVLRLPGVVSDAAQEEAEALQPVLQGAVDAALKELVAAREAEGGRLAAELGEVLGRIGAGVEAIRARVATLPNVYRDRLRERLDGLLAEAGVEVDLQTLAREVAVLADRSDVAEELTRLAAHVAHVEEVLAKGGAVGRKLDFLVQEMNREANTIGSKSADLEVTRRVVDLKTDVERLREQVQNLE